MQILTRLLILIAVALMAARPVMACCFVGHDAAHMDEVSAEAPPCHGDRGITDEDVEAPPSDPLDLGCPGCADCNIALVQSADLLFDSVLTAGAQGVQFATTSALIEPRKHTPLALKTGPPRYGASKLSTPITLKQRLLI